jgi:hypothetical protein
MTQKSAVFLFICWLLKDYEISLIPIYCSKCRRRINMEWAGQGGSGPVIILGSTDNYIRVIEENHDNQINLRGFGAAFWSQVFLIGGELWCDHKAT